MFSNKKRDKDITIDEDIHSSRHTFFNDDDPRFPKTDTRDNITARLAENFNAVMELLKERKALLLRKIQRMYEDNSDRIQAISKGRLSDLRNQAKLLRDETISNLIENSDRMSNTKSLLKRIIEQHNFTQFQTMQMAKGKKFYDRCKQVQSDLQIKTKKFNQLLEQQQRLNERERDLFSKIQNLKSDMSGILKRRQYDYERKAQKIQSQLQKLSEIIRDNKAVRDKKKKDMEIILENIMDTIHTHENHTISRIADIEDLFGGSQDSQDFQRFLRQLENIIDSKLDQRKDDKKQAAIQELIKIANGYDAYVQQIYKDRQKETQFFQHISEGLKSLVKTTLIEKAYFQEVSKDKVRLAQILRKCKSYNVLLNNFDGQRAKLNKEMNRLNQMKNSFAPRWKALASEEMRKEQLRKELSQLQVKQNQLYKLERKCKEVQYANNNYTLTRQLLEKEINQLAERSNFKEYKARMKQLEKLDKDYQSQADMRLYHEYDRLRTTLDEEVHSINARYADIIQDLIMDGEQLNPMHFIAKLTTRLSIV